MTVFKSLYIQGLPFFNGYKKAIGAIRKVKIDGVLELILDPKQNLIQAFKKWAHSEGHRATDTSDDSNVVRLFINKLSLVKKKQK